MPLSVVLLASTLGQNLSIFQSVSTRILFRRLGRPVWSFTCF